MTRGWSGSRNRSRARGCAPGGGHEPPRLPAASRPTSSVPGPTSRHSGYETAALVAVAVAWLVVIVRGRCHRPRGRHERPTRRSKRTGGTSPTSAGASGVCPPLALQKTVTAAPIKVIPHDPPGRIDGGNERKGCPGGIDHDDSAVPIPHEAPA